MKVPFPIFLPSHKTIPFSSILTQLLAPPWSIMAACAAVRAECMARACWDVYVPAQGCLQSYTELFDSLQHRLASVYLSQFPTGFVCTIRAAQRGSKRVIPAFSIEQEHREVDQRQHNVIQKMLMFD